MMIEMKTIRSGVAAPAGATLADGSTPQHAGQAGWSKGGKITAASNIRVHNARNAATARAIEGAVECSHIECHKLVPPSKRQKGYNTCGKKTCAHFRNKK